jgi:hypothetical protein
LEDASEKETLNFKQVRSEKKVINVNNALFFTRGKQNKLINA